MRLLTERYRDQEPRWPRSGRVILAQFDADSVVVYQAYRPGVGRFAASHGYFGDGFSLARMSWIKPNFLWMMYRCGWGTKPEQETVLAVRLRRSAFDEILSQAVPSTFVPSLYLTQDDWRKAVAESSVRIQWDPDHDPAGAKQERRAIQLGLRGQVLERYSRDWIVEIEDLTEFVGTQRAHVSARSWPELVTPLEDVYSIEDTVVARRLGLDEEQEVRDLNQGPR